MVTSIGSLPHRDADIAAAFVLRHHPDLPAAPQLPKRSALEGMIAQAARGIPGVEVAPDGSLTVDATAVDPEAPVVPPIDGQSHAGLLAFLSAAAGRTGPVKIQLTGPVTLGMALRHAGLDSDRSFRVAAAAVRATAEAVLALVRRRLPEAPVLAFLDEPGLVRVVDGNLPLDTDGAVDVLSNSLAALEVDAVTGVHCCGPTDWRLPAMAGATVLAMPVDHRGPPPTPAVLAAHLDRGGWVAWGAVPTSRPVGTDAEPLWRRLSQVWHDLAQHGCDPMQLRAQSLVTPECGLAGHGLSQASRALRLSLDVAQRSVERTLPGSQSARA